MAAATDLDELSDTVISFCGFHHPRHPSHQTHPGHCVSLHLSVDQEQEEAGEPGVITFSAPRILVLVPLGVFAPPTSSHYAQMTAPQETLTRLDFSLKLNSWPSGVLTQTCRLQWTLGGANQHCPPTPYLITLCSGNIQVSGVYNVSGLKVGVEYGHHHKKGPEEDIFPMSAQEAQPGC